MHAHPSPAIASLARVVPLLHQIRRRRHVQPVVPRRRARERPRERALSRPHVAAQAYHVSLARDARERPRERRRRALARRDEASPAVPVVARARARARRRATRDARRGANARRRARPGLASAPATRAAARMTTRSDDASNRATIRRARATRRRTRASRRRALGDDVAVDDDARRATAERARGDATPDSIESVDRTRAGESARRRR